MHLNRNKLYSIIFIACLVGYIWIFINIYLKIPKKGFEICFIKNITTIPCPACGSTRSVISILKGNFVEAIMINPLGYLTIIIMLLSPLWLVADILFKKKTYFEFYNKIENYLKNPKFAISLLILLIINWIWNITKKI